MLNLNYKPEFVVDTENMPQDDWLKWRTTGIGGSDVASIYEISPWTTKRALYFAKIGLQKNEDLNPFTLGFGHKLEDWVAEWFQMSFKTKQKPWLEAELGVKLKDIRIYKDTNMYRHPLHPFMQANLDYRFDLILEDNSKLSGIFECKTTNYHTGPEKWGIFNGVPCVPSEYVLQCRHYMSIMNEDLTIIACAWGNNENDYCARIIKRDLAEEEEMISLEEDFWYNNVKKSIAPKLSIQNANQEAIASKSYNISKLLKDGKLPELKHSDKEICDATQNYIDTYNKISSLKKEIKNLENSLTMNKLILSEAMDDATSYVKIGDKTYVIQNKKSISKRLDSDRIKNERPDIFRDYSKESEMTRFSVKEYMIS